MDLLRLDQLADVLEAALREREAELRLEQAVYGLDSLDEVALHAVLERCLTPVVHVSREVHYPSSAGRKLSHRMRCDLVLTPPGRPLRLDSKPPTLFDPPDSVGPESALWIEVKTAHQFEAPLRRRAGYGTQWRSGVVDDLVKIEAEPLIRNAALLLLVFTESRQVVEKDLENFEDLLALRQVLAGFRQVRAIDLLDRIGHRVCTLALWPTVQR